MPTQSIGSLQKILFLPLAIGVLATNSGCEQVSTAGNINRNIGRKAAAKVEPKNYMEDDQKAWDDFFINELKKINSCCEELNKYQKLISLCNQAIDYNSEGMSKGRTNILPNFFRDFKIFVKGNFPDLEIRYHDLYPDATEERDINRNESLKLNQILGATWRYCEKRIRSAP